MSGYQSPSDRKKADAVRAKLAAQGKSAAALDPETARRLAEGLPLQSQDFVSAARALGVPLSDLDNEFTGGH